jgi:hypothetical protein
VSGYRWELLVGALQLFSAGAAIIAALFWMAAARQPVAEYVSAGYGDQTEALKPINTRIKRGAQLNSRAAFAAAAAAFLQAWASLIPLMAPYR